MKFLIIFAIIATNVVFAWDNFSSQSNVNGVSINRISQNGNTVISRRSLLDNGEEKSVLSISSPNVLIDGEKFTCSGVECPKETAKCEVTSETLASDRQKMKNIVECKDENDKVLEKGENIEQNPHPFDEPPYSRVATVSRDGDVEISDSRNYVMKVGGTKKLTKEQQEELNKNMRRINQEFASRMGEFENNMNQVQQNMQKTFGNNFPFGNSNPFGENFPFGNSNPFGNNFPFGNNYNPFANFRTFFYTPPVTNNFNGYVTGSYPSYSTTTHDYQQPEPRESEFAVEQFNPVYRQPTYSSNPYDRYRYSTY